MSSAWSASSAWFASRPGREGRRRAFAAWTAAILFAANPNLIYMQATAMGETLYLAFFIWAVCISLNCAEREGAHEVRAVPGSGLLDAL